MGCVYILKNAAMPGLIKIGYTKENAEKRAKELYTTGVPQLFEVVYTVDQLAPEQYEKLEREIHKELAQYRVNPKREFFEYPADDAIQLLKKIHPTVLRESHGLRWLKWVPGLKGFRSRKKGDSDKSDPDETDTTDIDSGGVFMHNENGNGVNIDLDGKPYHSADSGFACAAAGHGIPEAVRTHIDVIVRNEELEIASNHEQIRRELSVLRDNKNTLEASQQNYQKEIKASEQEIAAKDVSLAELKAKLEAPAEMEVMPSLDPVLEALRDEKKEQERELADKKITHATLRVASKAPTLVELSLKAAALPGSEVVSEVPALAEASPIPLKPGLSIRQLCVAIGATLVSIMLLFYLYVFYSSVAEKAFAPRYEQQNYEQANSEQIDEQALNQFVDPRALQEAWKSPKNWFVLLFPMVFVAFAYVAHFCLNRVMEGNPKWFIWLIIVLGVTLGLDGIIATNIAENIQDIKMKAESYAPGTFTDIESTGKDILSVILLGFTVSLLLSGSLYCTLQEWGDVRPMAKQIKAEKNKRKVKLAQLRAEIEALEHDINSLDTQIAAQLKAHRHPLQVEIDRITVETENLNKEVKALDEVAARIQSEIGKCQTKIDELEEALKHPEGESIDLKKMEAHVNDFVSGWCRFVAQRKTELPDDLSTQIEDIRTTAHQTLEDYKAALPA